jgi:hypothetical protein
MKLTYEALLANPDRLNELHAAARRERAQAVHRTLIAPLVRAFAVLFEQQPPQRHTRMLHRSATCG